MWHFIHHFPVDEEKHFPKEVAKSSQCCTQICAKPKCGNNKPVMETLTKKKPIQYGWKVLTLPLEIFFSRCVDTELYR